MASRLRGTNAAVALTSLLGLLLSVYSFHVETAKEKDSSYKPMCDISQSVSCTAAFMSRYGKGFGLVDQVVGVESPFYQPNSIYGIIFYSLVPIVGLFQSLWMARLQVVLAVVSNFGSIYLGYILYFVVHSMCVVCVSTYVVNFILLLLAWKRVRILKADDSTVASDFSYLMDGKKRV